MRTLSALFTLALTVPSFAQEGVTLYQGFTSMTTQLIDGAGTTVHDWSATAGPGLSVYLQPNGDLIRTRAVSSGVAGAGGGVERVTFDGTVLWQWELIDPNLIPHHDVTVLPNGNVLVLVAETHGDTAAIAQGRDPSTAGPVFMAERIIELQPTGSTATIVWEWNAWDHMVQDFDSNLPNFGVVADHPELFDLNYPPVLTSDWLHFNGLDYNEDDLSPALRQQVFEAYQRYYDAISAVVRDAAFDLHVKHHLRGQRDAAVFLDRFRETQLVGEFCPSHRNFSRGQQ